MTDGCHQESLQRHVWQRVIAAAALAARLPTAWPVGRNLTPGPHSPRGRFAYNPRIRQVTSPARPPSRQVRVRFAHTASWGGFPWRRYVSAPGGRQPASRDIGRTPPAFRGVWVTKFHAFRHAGRSDFASFPPHGHPTSAGSLARFSGLFGSPKTGRLAWVSSSVPHSFSRLPSATPSGRLAVVTFEQATQAFAAADFADSRGGIPSRRWRCPG